MEELVKKAQSGDKEAFTNLMLSVKNDLYKIAKARLKSDDDVYEAIQETMITAFKVIKKLKKPLCFRTWIIKILISKSNNIYSKKNKSNIISLDEVENYKKINDCEIEYTEATLDFKFVCKKLKYEDRMIIMLYYMEHLRIKK